MSPAPHLSTPPRVRRRVAVIVVTSFALLLALVATTANPAASLPPRDSDGGGGYPEPTEPPAPTTTVPPATPPTAGFGWTIAPRVGGANSSSDLNALAAYINQPIQVRLYACGSQAGSAPITSYTWNLNGASASGCNPTWSIPRGGVFTVSVTVRDSAGRSSTSTQTLNIKDKYVVALGDSIASGEGNPQRVQQYDWLGFVTAGPQWPNRRCHRTPNSASQQAMATYERQHPQEAVTYVNLACSGAQIPNLIQARFGGVGYAGMEPDGFTEAPQLDQVETLRALTGRTPTEVYLSIGANDFGFSNIAKECAHASSMWSSTSQCAAQLDGAVYSGHSTIVGPYTGVNQYADFQQGRYYRLSTALTNAGIQNSRVMLSQYPDPTKNDSGGWCNAIMDDTPLGLGRINQVDVIWAGGVVQLLNNDVLRATQFTGWKAVQVHGDFQTHGYCANGRYVNRYGESNDRQGNIDGTLHPNAAGTATYATRIGQTYQSYFSS